MTFKTIKAKNKDWFDAIPNEIELWLNVCTNNAL